MSVVIKGSEPFDVMIASNIVNCQTANIKFKNISFRCETIEDADGTVFVKMPSAQPEIIYCSECKFAQYDPMFHMLWCEGRVVFSRHYCSLGKRREEE